MAAKGRNVPYDTGYQNTIVPGSAEQGILIAQDAMIDQINGNQIVSIASSAGAGGAATEAMTVTGLKTTDTIISVSQKTKGANSLPLLGWTTQAANALTCVWSADPGASSVVVVTVLRSNQSLLSKVALN